MTFQINRRQSGRKPQINGSNPFGGSIFILKKITICPTIPESSASTWKVWDAIELLSIAEHQFRYRSLIEVTQVPVNNFAGIGPGTTGVRVIGPPNNVADTHNTNNLCAQSFILKRRVTLAGPKFAWLHTEADLGREVVVLLIHPVEHVGNPSYPALAKYELKIRVSIACAGENYAR
jgi:hypothetical protein